MSTRPVPWRSERVARLTGEALLLRALQDLCVSDGRYPEENGPNNHSYAVSEKTSVLLSPSASSTKTLMPFHRAPGYFFESRNEIVNQPSKRFSSGASVAGSESSQIIADFFSDAGSFSSSVHSEFDAAEAKLALWQAILVAVGYCEGHHGEIVKDVNRPPHFPDPSVPVPDSLTACRRLIQENVFINIVNFKRNQLNKEPLLLFNNNVDMWEYTKKYARFIRLTKAKQDLLNPLLRHVNWKRGLQPVSEEESGGEEGRGDAKKVKKEVKKEMTAVPAEKDSNARSTTAAVVPLPLVESAQ